MADYVIDVNVWIMVDKSLADVETEAELKCIAACLKWLQDFMAGDNRFVVDSNFAIYKEYRRYITQKRQQANEWLNQLQRSPRDREITVDIEFDDDGNAKIPFEFDPNDRKFIACALKHKATYAIVNATDTDWQEKKEILIKNGITVEELCPEYIDEKIKNKTN